MKKLLWPLRIIAATLAVGLLAAQFFVLGAVRCETGALQDEVDRQRQRHSRSLDAASTVELTRAIDRSADFLARSCKSDGQFVYRVNLDPRYAPAPKYNLLRHAGTMHALVRYEHVAANEETRHALLRAADYLKRTSLAPIPGESDLLAVWSHAEQSGTAETKCKLGGTGLALVALAGVEDIAPGTTQLEDLRRMGRFLQFMQKNDGSFYSMYIPAQGGRNDEWTSLYYPGEAVLGLLLLYEKDPAPQWLNAAAAGIAHLATIRAGRADVPADHWALLATARLLPLYEKSSQPVPRSAVLQHAVQICESILNDQPLFSLHAPQRGGFAADGRTCPTATRLEGLLAALQFLPDERKELRERIERAIDEGIALLLRSQIQEGEFAGAMPRAVCRLPEEHPLNSPVFHRRATELRIDYAQHALCALIDYRELVAKRSAAASDRVPIVEADGDE